MLKTNLVLGFMLMMLLALSTSLMAQTYSGGSGTSIAPYQIANKTDLRYLSEHSGEWTKHFIQTADITFTAADFESGGYFYNSGNGFIPIGGGSYGSTDFDGSYNGNGFMIENLYINRTSVSRIGFFGRIDSSGDLDDINLVNVDITGGGQTAALVGQPYGAINDCRSSGSVSGTSTVGGLVGQVNSGSSIADCYSTATVNSSGYEAGGFAASSMGTITRCYSTGNVSGTSVVGGFIGNTENTIQECFSTGNVSGTENVGGFIGKFDVGFSQIITCYCKGNVTRTSGTETSFGGFCGLIEESGAETSTIEKCYSIGDVSCGSATDKGFVGTDNSGTYNDNFFDSEASNQTSATGATAKNTAQMKTQSTFTDASWNFTTTWEIVGGDGANYPRLIDNPDPTLPVTLSTFTAQYIEDIPILCWTTQSETSNAGWNIYRGETSEALSNEEAYQLNLSLGLIPGAGTTSLPTEYSFEDVFPIYLGTTYFYWLESVDYSGESEIYGPISLTIPENEWENPNSPEIPKPYGLHQNYPNPFNPNTEISFMMKESCIGELIIYNIKGQKIKTIFSNLSITGDELIIYNWDGKDETGKDASTGVYYYKLQTTKGNFVRKMILMK